MLKKWISTGVFLLCLMCSPMAFAYVDDAGVMNQFDYDNATPLWDYINANGIVSMDKARWMTSTSRPITACSSPSAAAASWAIFTGILLGR